MALGDHIRPTAPVAADALLPGDPRRAMELATALMERPLMSNLNRGLWGYHGTLAGGRELTVQSTGIGGPSGAVVLTELAGHGVRRAIRVGTCTALDPGLALGTRIVIAAALGEDGVSAALGAPTPALPDPALTDALREALPECAEATVVTTDLLDVSGVVDDWGRLRGTGAAAADMCTAPLLALGSRVGVAVGAVLVIARDAEGRRLADDELDRATLAAGTAAAEALSPAG